MVHQPDGRLFHVVGPDVQVSATSPYCQVVIRRSDAASLAGSRRRTRHSIAQRRSIVPSAYSAVAAAQAAAWALGRAFERNSFEQQARRLASAPGSPSLRGPSVRGHADLRLLRYSVRRVRPTRRTEKQPRGKDHDDEHRY
jgi:hypothetical protein